MSRHALVPQVSRSIPTHQMDSYIPHMLGYDWGAYDEMQKRGPLISISDGVIRRTAAGVSPA